MDTVEAKSVTSRPGATAIVRADTLRRFSKITAELGGDAEALLAAARIDPDIFSSRHAVIPLRSQVRLLEHAAEVLNRPDFGMRLAEVQVGENVMGPLEIAMRNSATVGEALRYCVEHVRVYSTGTNLTLETPEEGDVALLRFRAQLPKSVEHAQSIEYTLLLLQRTIIELSGGATRAQEIWFAHSPVASLSTYEEHFGSPALFDRPCDALVLARSDLDREVATRDPLLHELATHFIELHYPERDVGLGDRVMALVEQLLEEGRCAHTDVAAMLGMHPRTFQRRLKAEGKSFEAIKDAVRKDLALRYLKQSELPIIRVAELLGYSDTSVLSRSCYRWFSASPRKIRMGGTDPS